MKTRYLAYCSVTAAIAALTIIACFYLPTNIVPLIIASLCFYIALDRCKWWGLLSILGALLISFFVVSFQGSFVLTLVVFAPYSILAYILKKFTYFKAKSGVFRGFIMLVFFSIVAVALFFLIEFLAGIEIASIINKIGYVFTLLIFAVVCLIADFFFSFASQKIVGMLDRALGKNKRKNSTNTDKNDKTESNNTQNSDIYEKSNNESQKEKDDIFNDDK